MTTEKRRKPDVEPEKYRDRLFKAADKYKRDECTDFALMVIIDEVIAEIIKGCSE